MSHNYYGHNQGNGGYPPPNPNVPPAFYQNQPRYGSAPYYPPAPHLYPVPPNAQHHSPQAFPPFASPGASWQNQGPRHNRSNNRHNSGQRFNGNKKYNNNKGGGNKFNNYAQNSNEIQNATEDSSKNPNTEMESNDSEQETSDSEEFPVERSNKSGGHKMEKTSHDRANQNEGYPNPHPYPPPQPFCPPPYYGAPPGYPMVAPPPHYGYPPIPNMQPPPHGYPPYPPHDGGWHNFRPPFNGPQHNWNQNNKRKFNDNNGTPNSGKKQKVDKRELPENNKFCCDTCNRGFKTEELFKTHMDSHVKCRFEGCDFVGHEKLVHMHIEHVHLSGLASKLESAKNIDEWKAERRRNYPTKENMERKEKERQEAIERGEIEDKPGKRGKGKKSWQEKRREKYLNRQLNKQQTDAQVNTTEEVKTETKTESTEVSDMMPSSTQDSTLSSVEQIVSQEATNSTNQDDNIPRSEPIAEQMKDEVASSAPMHEDKKIEDPILPVEYAKSVVDSKKSKKQQHQHQNNPQRKKLSFAEKFMERDIKQEMNVMLQVAAFFVKKLNEEAEANKTDVVGQQSGDTKETL